MAHFTVQEIIIFSRLGIITGDDKSPKLQVILFLESMVQKHDDSVIITLEMSDVAKLFEEWQTHHQLTTKIPIIKLGCIIHHLKINGITKGQRKSSGNTKIFNIKQIKDHFNARATQEPQ